MLRFHIDPGPCPVCGAEHTACTTDSGPITVQQLPQRDAAAAVALTATPAAAAPLVAEQVQATLPPGTFTSGTYRKKR